MGGGVDQPERRRAIADGSKRPLELTAVDAQAKPDIGLNAIKRLVGDPTVVVFLGPDWSSVTYPTLFVGEEAGSAQITSSVAQRITQEGQKHIFRARSTDGEQRVRAERSESLCEGPEGSPQCFSCRRTVLCGWR
jgi:ABC-type branched-subunit amino acid transport system substrate-binding protein